MSAINPKNQDANERILSGWAETMQEMDKRHESLDSTVSSFIELFVFEKGNAIEGLKNRLIEKIQDKTLKGKIGPIFDKAYRGNQIAHDSSQDSTISEDDFEAIELVIQKYPELIDRIGQIEDENIFLKLVSTLVSDKFLLGQVGVDRIMDRLRKVENEKARTLEQREKFAQSCIDTSLEISDLNTLLYAINKAYEINKAGLPQDQPILPQDQPILIAEQLITHPKLSYKEIFKAMDTLGITPGQRVLVLLNGVTNPKRILDILEKDKKREWLYSEKERKIVEDFCKLDTDCKKRDKDKKLNLAQMVVDLFKYSTTVTRDKRLKAFQESLNKRLPLPKDEKQIVEKFCQLTLDYIKVEEGKKKAR